MMMPTSEVSRMVHRPPGSHAGGWTVIRCLSKIAFIIIFFLIGLSTGIIGPSILYLEKLSSSREDEIALVFTSRSVGYIGGWIISCVLLDLDGGASKPSNLLNIGLFGLILSHGLIIFIEHLWWVLAVFFLQGLFTTICLQACVYYHWNKKNWFHSIPQHLTIIFLLGCVFTPYIILFIEPNSQTILSMGVRSNQIPHDIQILLPNEISTAQNASNNHQIHLIGVIDSNPKDKHNEISRMIRIPRHISNTTILAPNMINITSSRIKTLEHLKNDKSDTNSSLMIVINSTLSKGNKSTGGIEHHQQQNNNNKTLSNVSSTPVQQSTSIKKPSINDAKHLNQDSSSADGSKAASKMKKIGEEHQIDKVADETSASSTIQKVSPSSSTTPLSSVTNQSKDSLKENLLNTTVILGSGSVLDGINKTLISNNNNSNNGVVNGNALNYQNSSLPHISFQVDHIPAPSVKNSSIPTHQNMNETVKNNNNNHKTNLSQGHSSTIPGKNETAVIFHIYNITEKPKNSTDNNHSSIHFIFYKPTSLLPPTTRTTAIPVTTPAIAGGDTDDNESSDVGFMNATVRKRHRIAEHLLDKSYLNHILILPFQQPMESIQKVYLLLCIISVIPWILTIPLTSWCKSIFIRVFGLQILDENDHNDHGYELIPIPQAMMTASANNNNIRRVNSDNGSHNNNSEEGIKSKLLDRSGDENESDSDELWNRRKTGYANNAVEPDYHYCSDSEMNDYSSSTGSILPGNPPTPHYTSFKSTKQSSFSDENNDNINTNTNSNNNNNTNDDSIDTQMMLMINKSIFDTHWPRIEWPSEFWLLLSVFLNSGLETTYGGFVASFTLRYLLWSPTLAIIVTSVFWFGDLVGYLIRYGIISIKWPDLLHTLPSSSSSNSSTDQTSCKRIISLRKLRRNHFKSSKPSIITIIQLCGCLICVISAIALTHLSVSTGRCSTAPTASTLSHPYLIWFIGSFCFGIGIGLSSTFSGTLLTPHINSNLFSAHSYNIQLAYYFGQLLMPSLIAMLHHQALFWRYSCVLSTAVLCLSILLSCTLIGHFISETIKEKKAKHGDSQLRLLLNHNNQHQESRNHRGTRTSSDQ